MGQLRNALRGVHPEGFDCGEALTRLNRLVTTWAGGQFADRGVASASTPGTRRAALLRQPAPAPMIAAPGERPTAYTEALGPPIGALST
jgi:hypothetical protein